MKFFCVMTWVLARGIVFEQVTIDTEDFIPEYYKSLVAGLLNV